MDIDIKVLCEIAGIDPESDSVKALSAPKSTISKGDFETLWHTRIIGAFNRNPTVGKLMRDVIKATGITIQEFYAFDVKATPHTGEFKLPVHNWILRHAPTVAHYLEAGGDKVKLLEMFPRIKWITRDKAASNKRKTLRRKQKYSRAVERGNDKVEIHFRDRDKLTDWTTIK